MVVAIIPTIKIADSTSDELEIVNAGDATGKGIIMFGKYDLDMATKTTAKVYPTQLGKHGSQVIKTEQAHYLASGYKFGFAHELEVATGSEVLLWVLAAGTRDVVIDKITFMVHLGAGSAQIEYKVYVQPNLKNNGTGITIGNLLAGNATAATASAYYTPTAGASSGTQIGEINVLEGYSFDVFGENNMGLVASSGKLLITGTSSATRDGCVMIWFHEVTA